MALLGEQQGSRSLMSHHFSSGSTKELGRAGAGRTEAMGGGDSVLPSLVATWECMRKKDSGFPGPSSPRGCSHLAISIQQCP